MTNVKSSKADRHATEFSNQVRSRSPSTTMVLHNPNNWHWVNKDVSGWTREYLDKELVQIAAEQDGVTAKIDKVVSMDGDVDVSQRKGKVITIFDVKLKLEYSGT
jgi:activator of HSP90 ATPase